MTTFSMLVQERIKRAEAELVNCDWSDGKHNDRRELLVAKIDAYKKLLKKLDERVEYAGNLVIPFSKDQDEFYLSPFKLLKASAEHYAMLVVMEPVIRSRTHKKAISEPHEFLAQDGIPSICSICGWVDHSSEGKRVRRFFYRSAKHAEERLHAFKLLYYAVKRMRKQVVYFKHNDVQDLARLVLAGAGVT
ncbi:MAG: hypothetical protein Q7S03_04270 [bacterium]|nr:hypothetical protein [bacterium]